VADNRQHDEFREETAVEQDRAAIVAAGAKGPGATLSTYLKLSGPGFLQSAITLGGGTLGSALYLGAVGGMSMLWVQPLAMVLGVVMLSAIGYVTLSTGRRPFGLINREVNPVLGWGWALAAMLANFCWILPQFTLAVEAIRMNLLPGVLGPPGADVADPIAFNNTRNLFAVLVIGVASLAVVLSYGGKGRGVKLFELILKVTVAVIVFAFIGVVIRLATADAFAWGSVFSGLIPNPASFFNPAADYESFLSAVDPQFRAFWEDRILGDQRNFIISAAAVAVGINMTFLMPYSLLKRGWDKDFRGLAIFDLASGLFVPFLIVTVCIVIAAASQFHANTNSLETVIVDGREMVQPKAAIRGGWTGVAKARLSAELGTEAVAAMDAQTLSQRLDALPLVDKQLSSMLIRRQTQDLAGALAPLIGAKSAQFLFGLGVLAMAISTAIIIMIINGFVFCEIFGRPGNMTVFRIGAILPWLLGLCAPFFWTKAAPFLIIPVSMFGAAVLPIAYLTFFVLMNSRRALGDQLPTGARRLWWNLAMGVALALSTISSLWVIWNEKRVYQGYFSGRTLGLTLLGLFIALALVVHFMRRARRAS
jgi:Mn2+/Fe2+ NRAMP family transporter